MQSHAGARRLARGRLAMHEDPRFWALFVAIWIGLVLSVMNIAVKVHLFLDLAGQ
jgi:hypothetical protein